jgi:hypothetical protein
LANGTLQLNSFATLQLSNEFLHQFALGPCGWMESESGNSLRINQELLKIPSDVIYLHMPF